MNDINDGNQMNYNNFDSQGNMSSYDMKNQENVNYLRYMENCASYEYENNLEFMNNNNVYTSQQETSYVNTYQNPNFGQNMGTENEYDNGYGGVENTTNYQYNYQETTLNSYDNANQSAYAEYQDVSTMETADSEQPYTNDNVNNEIAEDMNNLNSHYTNAQDNAAMYFNNQNNMYYGNTENESDVLNNGENSLEKNNEARQRLNVTKVTETVGELAPMKLRKKAYLIDKGVMLIPMIIMYFVFLNSAIVEIINNVILYQSPLNTIETIIGPMFGFLIMYLIISFIYYVIVPYVTKGKTIGKSICNIRIVTTDVDSSAPGIDVLFKREIVEKFKASILFIGYICSYKNKEGIAKHDKSTNTRVIYEKPLDIDQYGAYDTNVSDYIEKE